MPGFVTTWPRTQSSASRSIAGRGRRRDVEHVERVDERDELAAGGGGGEHLQEEARAARRSRTDELGQLAARKPAAQPCV